MDAIQKINAEMQKKPDDKFREVIGHYIIDRCSDPSCAEKVMDEKKTLEDALDKIIDLAKKSKYNQCAVLSDDVVFAEVDKYFGFAKHCAEQKIEAPAAGISVDLMSFFDD